MNQARSSYLPNGTFKLFSLTQMTLERWIIGGNNKSIWIKKGCNKIVFDIIIPTAKGILFTMNFAWDTKNTNETTNLKA
jgi:hypothetical protein